MARKSSQADKPFSPPFQKHLRLQEGSIGWTRNFEGGSRKYSSDGELNFDILIGNGYVILVAFDHDPIDDAEFWRKRFNSVKAAMEYAEKM